MNYIATGGRLAAPADENLRRSESRADYQRRHRRVVMVRGKASGHTCEECGGPARDWATIHGVDGSDPAHYRPLCCRCHRIYDDVGRKALATRLRNVAAQHEVAA